MTLVYCVPHFKLEEEKSNPIEKLQSGLCHAVSDFLLLLSGISDKDTECMVISFSKSAKCNCIPKMLSSFEHHNSFFFQVEENKTLRFMSYERAKISSDKYVPVRRPSRVKLSFNAFCAC